LPLVEKCAFGSDMTVIHGEVTGEAEPGRRRGHLPLAVELDGAAGHERVGAGVQRLAQHVAEVSDLVAAESETYAVVALRPERRTTEVFRKGRHRLERCRQVREIDRTEPRQPLAKRSLTS
jgi:hypothetical protein